MKTIVRIERSSAMHWVGNGFPVRSVLNYNDHGRELSPFLLLDYAAPHSFPPGRERRGVGAHPHKGFETVTVVYQGQLEHRDSTGAGGKIGPGDVQWMTAGAGIVHEEFHSEEFTQAGGPMQMVQLWINLRAADKSAQPGYQTLLDAQIPSVTLPSGGAVRVIAGALEGKRGPARTFTAINLWDAKIPGGSTAELPLAHGHTTALLVLSGELVTDAAGSAKERDLIIYSRDGEHIQISAASDAHCLLMSGEPINEPIVGHGPFVMNTPEEIQQAFRDYQLGRMGELH
ncbi:MAG TPA: pirin family protein [Methylomirabilota bacterium]|nr:pirin family protein [Methylomirabilota bacterium]